MARLGDFDRLVKVATAGLEPQAIARKLAQHAQEQNARVLAEQEARSGMRPHVTVAVNGRMGVAEDQVVPPGPIVYTYSYAQEVVGYAYHFLVARSPQASGDYKRAWFAMVNGNKVDLEQIPGDAGEVILANDKPYHRKIDVGAMQMSVPPQIVEDARQAMQARFGNMFKFDRIFILLAGGYVLKGRQRVKAAARNDRSSAHRGGRTKLASRKDLMAGQAMTYPALRITLRG